MRLLLKATALLLSLSLFPAAFVPPAQSQTSSTILNAIFNPGFEALDGTWGVTYAQQKGTTTIYDSTNAHSGSSLSTKLSANLSVPAGSIGEVQAGVGQSIRYRLEHENIDYSLANLADSPDSFSVWWYVQPELGGPHGLEMQLFFCGMTCHTLSYFYGNIGKVNSTTWMSFNLGRIDRTGVWFETERNIYRDLQEFGIEDISSFEMTYVVFLAIGNYTHGEIAWVDDVGLLFNPPVARFAVKQPSSTELEIQFDGSASMASQGASITAYSWDFGDGKTSSLGPTLTHAYSAPGAYAVTLNVTDSKGRVATSTSTVLVFQGDPPPSLFFAYASGLVMSSVFLIALLIRKRRGRLF